MKAINGRYKIKNVRSWKNENPRVRMVHRDFLVLKFINEMKFAGVREIHQMFFRNKTDGSTSDSLAWAEERLRQLERVNFLDSKRFFVDEPRAYFLTRFGYSMLVNNVVCQEEVPAFLSSIDIRQYQHDATLCRLRAYLESGNRLIGWTSERCLRIGQKMTRLRFVYNTPDALVQLHGEEPIALELELTRKTRKRLNDRIYFYGNSTSRFQNNLKFKRVLVLCGEKYAKRSWDKHSWMYRDCYIIKEFSPKSSIEAIASLIVPKNTAETSCTDEAPASISAPGLKAEVSGERSEEYVSAH